jgi:hypothetical protein
MKSVRVDSSRTAIMEKLNDEKSLLVAKCLWTYLALWSRPGPAAVSLTGSGHILVTGSHPAPHYKAHKCPMLMCALSTHFTAYFTVNLYHLPLCIQQLQNIPAISYIRHWSFFSDIGEKTLSD